MARYTKVKNPHHFHILPLKLSCRVGLLNNININLEVRELMKIYQALQGRIDSRLLEDIERFLNSLAELYPYENFDINERITKRNVGVKND